MALSDAARAELFRALSPLAGEEATGEMLAHFPSHPDDDPVTRRDLDLRLAELSADMDRGFHELRSEMRAGFHAVDLRFAAIDQRFTEQDAKWDQRFAEQDARSDKRFALVDLRFAEQGAAIAGLRAELHQALSRQTTVIVTSLVALTALFTFVLQIVGP